MMIVSIVFFCIGFVTIILAFAFYRSQKAFVSKCRFTTASVIGYYVEDNSSVDTPRVMFEVDGQEIKTRAQPVRDKNRPQVGDRVEIAYVKGSFAGKDTWEVKILQDGNLNTGGSKAAIAAGILGAVFLIVAVILLCMMFF